MPGDGVFRACNFAEVLCRYTGYRNRRKPAGTKKSIRRMIQELALPPHRRDATPFATK